MKNLAEPAAVREIAARLAAVTPDDPARFGKMTPHQMLGHLNDAYLVPLCRRAITPVKSPLRLPPAALKWLALRSGMQWRPGFPAPPEIAQDKGGTPPTDLDRDRATLLATIDEFATRLPQPCPSHPFFGDMTPDDWMRWGYLHADHHLRQFGR